MKAVMLALSLAITMPTQAETPREAQERKKQQALEQLIDTTQQKQALAANSYTDREKDAARRDTFEWVCKRHRKGSLEYRDCRRNAQLQFREGRKSVEKTQPNRHETARKTPAKPQKIMDCDETERQKKGSNPYLSATTYA